MKRIQLDEDIKPLSEFRSNVTAFLKQVKQTRRPLVITQRGKSSAVLLDVGEYEALLDKMELLEDIALAEKQLDEGKIISHSEAKKKVLGKMVR